MDFQDRISNLEKNDPKRTEHYFLADELRTKEQACRIADGLRKNTHVVRLSFSLTSLEQVENYDSLLNAVQNCSTLKGLELVEVVDRGIADAFLMAASRSPTIQSLRIHESVLPVKSLAKLSVTTIVFVTCSVSQMLDEESQYNQRLTQQNTMIEKVKVSLPQDAASLTLLLGWVALLPGLKDVDIYQPKVGSASNAVKQLLECSKSVEKVTLICWHFKDQISFKPIAQGLRGHSKLLELAFNCCSFDDENCCCLTQVLKNPKSNIRIMSLNGNMNPASMVPSVRQATTLTKVVIDVGFDRDETISGTTCLMEALNYNPSIKSLCIRYHWCFARRVAVFNALIKCLPTMKTLKEIEMQFPFVKQDEFYPIKHAMMEAFALNRSMTKCIIQFDGKGSSDRFINDDDQNQLEYYCKRNRIEQALFCAPEEISTGALPFVISTVQKREKGDLNSVYHFVTSMVASGRLGVQCVQTVEGENVKRKRALK